MARRATEPGLEGEGGGTSSRQSSAGRHVRAAIRHLGPASAGGTRPHAPHRPTAASSWRPTRRIASPRARGASPRSHGRAGSQLRAACDELQACSRGAPPRHRHSTNPGGLPRPPLAQYFFSAAPARTLFLQRGPNPGQGQPRGAARARLPMLERCRQYTIPSARVAGINVIYLPIPLSLDRSRLGLRLRSFTECLDSFAAA